VRLGQADRAAAPAEAALGLADEVAELADEVALEALAERAEVGLGADDVEVDEVGERGAHARLGLAEAVAAGVRSAWQPSASRWRNSRRWVSASRSSGPC
jgi:hypothetical protein